MFTVFILTILSALGFITAWTQTELKAHILGLVCKTFHKRSSEEITTLLYRYGTLGELLNCKYCLSAWVGLFFFLIYSAMPLQAALLFTAFFSMPAFVYLLHRETPIFTELDTTAVDTPQKPIVQNENPLLQNPEEHKRILFTNKDVFAMLVAPSNCNFKGCEEIVAEYQAELKDLEARAAADGTTCPDCKKGKVVNKYFYKLLGQRDKVSKG